MIPPVERKWAKWYPWESCKVTKQESHRDLFTFAKKKQHFLEYSSVLKSGVFRRREAHCLWHKANTACRNKIITTTEKTQWLECDSTGMLCCLRTWVTFHYKWNHELDSTLLENPRFDAVITNQKSNSKSEKKNTVLVKVLSWTPWGMQLRDLIWEIHDLKSSRFLHNNVWLQVRGHKLLLNLLFHKVTWPFSFSTINRIICIYYFSVFFCYTLYAEPKPFIVQNMLRFCSLGICSLI